MTHSFTPRPDVDLWQRYALHDRGQWHLRACMISSLDGAATVRGLSGGLNNPDDEAVMLTLRALSDVILVGAGTIRAEGYGAMRLPSGHAQWRREQGLPAQPRMAVVSQQARLDPRAELFAQAPSPVIVCTTSMGMERMPDRAELERVAEVAICGEEEVDLHTVQRELQARDLQQVVCEGGPTLLASVVQADLLDELCLTVSPLVVGGQAGRIVQDGAEVARRMHLVHALPMGDMMMLRYVRTASQPG